VGRQPVKSQCHQECASTSLHANEFWLKEFVEAQKNDMVLGNNVTPMSLSSAKTPDRSLAVAVPVEKSAPEPGLRVVEPRCDQME
jgi:hypothetical protein